MAAGTVTTTETTHTSVKKIKFAWTSGTGGEGGTASATTTYAYDGKIELLTTDPGSTAPTDNYDITLTDGDSVDVLAGAGANRDTTNTEQAVASSLGVVAGSKLTLNVTNAGDAKEGVVYVYIR
jgi:hypothetical protein